MKINLNQPKQSLSKRALSAHSWLGLVISAVMYIICLSGTLAVFHQEFERWEQPNVDEFYSFDYDQVTNAYATFTENYPEETGHMHVVFPSSGIPRLVVENDHLAHFVNPDGSLGAIENPHWTKMLVDLHLYLHLPNNVGMILVSAFGALLCSLVLSGLIAHPRIVKDAFRFRRGGNLLQQNIDVHNRLSVWATPFHLMIGVTGAYFGLAGILVTLTSQAFYEGNNQAVIEKVFTPEPTLEQHIQTPDIAKAIKDVQVRSPDGQLIFLTVHEPRTPGQFIEIYVKQPGRLIYSENFRYDVKGDFIETGGYQDGEAGKQIVYSLYRLHFGDYAGITSKLMYFVLGLMLTVVAATGINIWLVKRKTRDALNLFWPALVWGTPLSLLICAWLDLIVETRLDLILWTVLVGCMIVSLRYDSETKLKRDIKLLLSICIIAFLISYTVMHSTAAMSIASLQINLPLLSFACYLMMSWRKQRSDSKFVGAET